MLWMVHAVGFRSGYIAIEDQEDQMDIQNEGPEMTLLTALKERKKQAVDDMIRFGLPQESRPYLWKRLSGSIELELKYPHLYEELSKNTPPHKTLEAILADIPRTFNFSEDHSEQFEAQKGEELKALLSAYANYDTKLQYAQGMNYLAGVLLLHLPLEEAFWVFNAMMTELSLDILFAPDNTWFDTFDDLLKKVHPKVAAHMEKLGVSSGLFLSQWFRTFFLYSENLQFSIRVFDMFFVLGLEGLYRVGLALIGLYHDELLGLDYMGLLTRLTQLGEIPVEKTFEIASTLKFPKNYDLSGKLKNGGGSSSSSSSYSHCCCIIF